jgi:ABC-type hemin transport system substrate-binding protein
VRIVSLVPSSTETLLALGADVIACTRFCEQPQLPHVGGTKNPEIDAILRLAPDLVVVDREENRFEDHDALIAAGLDVFVSHVTDVESSLAVIGELARFAHVEHRASRTPSRFNPEVRRKAFVPIWRRPWMTISSSTYGAAVLDHIGVDLVSVGSSDIYPTVTLDDVAAATPDVILVPSEPYAFEARHLIEVQQAMPNVPLVRIDGQDLFWWGWRTPAAISRMVAALSRRPTP